MVETVKVASRRKQLAVLKLCHGVPEVTALGTSHGRKHFVVVESSEPVWQSAVEPRIAELDPSAHLVPTSSEPSSTSDFSEVVLDVLGTPPNVHLGGAHPVPGDA